MSGHSHWATTHRQKGLNDAKRGAIFTKAGKDITIAAQKGGDPDANFRLRLAIEAARAVNMPKENIERAIKKGTGELADGARLEEIVYEGFGPGNVALLMSTATDNKNRTVNELKSLFTKNGGKFGAVGSVAFLFRQVGFLVFSTEKYTTETLELETLESGADDFRLEENSFVVITKPENLQKVQKYFATKDLAPESAELGYLPNQTTTLSPEAKAAFLKFRDIIDDHSDVQMIWDTLA